MLAPFQLEFMQRAALEIALLAPLAGLLGAQIVLRRLAFYSHGVGAATFPGLVVAGPAGIPPAVAALGVGGAFAWVLARFGRRPGAIATDAATALLLVAALAVGIVLASDVFESGAGVDQALFGSLLGIGAGELRFTAVALVVAALAALRYRPTWIAGGFDPPSSRSLGLPVAGADLALIATIALAVVASVDAVGSLLVGAIFVVPAATVRLFATSVRSLEVGAGALAFAEGIAGLLIAFELDAPPGAAIAVLGGGVFAIALAARELARRRGSSRPAAAEAPA
jgi:ABC-type Mn2+/Zn2+ transport system permease subunit